MFLLLFIRTITKIVHPTCNSFYLKVLLLNTKNSLKLYVNVFFTCVKNELAYSSFCLCFTEKLALARFQISWNFYLFKHSYKNSLSKAFIFLYD